MRPDGRIFREVHRLQRLIALSLQLGTPPLEFVNSLLLSFGLLGISLALFVESFQFLSESAIFSELRFATPQQDRRYNA
jgi:hypothetical protein